jgi:3-oxoacyl-[acyl-carrier-protein] synthase II
MKRVVITGAGPVTAVGIGQDSFTDGIIGSDSGIMEISSFEHSKYPVRSAAAVQDFDAADYLPTPKNYLDRNTALSFGAFSLALANSRIVLDEFDRSQIAVTWGTAFGGCDTSNLFYGDIRKKGPRFGKPILFPHTYSNTAISMLCIEYRLPGPHMNFASGWTASGHALVYAYDMIISGRVPLAFAGGSEAFSETLFRYNLSKNILSSRIDENACRPFCGSADGTAMGEGAGMLVLEEADSASKRGARIFAEFAGAGMAAHGQCLSSETIISAMKKAMEEADVSPRDVDCVIASSGGIGIIDRAEASAIKNLFGNSTAVSTVKPLIGETFGAAGILQIHAALSMLDRQFIPGVGISSLIPEAEGLNIPAEGSARFIKTVLVNNLDPGGNAVSILLKGNRTSGFRNGGL